MRLIISLYIILFLTNCSDKSKYFIMPNGEKLETTDIINFEKTHSIKYEDYLGFTCEYGDAVLNKFVLLEEEYISSTDVLSKQQIEDSKHSRINYLRFNVLLNESENTHDSIIKYITDKYKGYEKKQIDKTEIIFSENNKTVCKIKYYDFANPNFAVLLYAN